MAAALMRLALLLMIAPLDASNRSIFPGGPLAEHRKAWGRRRRAAASTHKGGRPPALPGRHQELPNRTAQRVGGPLAEHRKAWGRRRRAAASTHKGGRPPALPGRHQELPNRTAQRVGPPQSYHECLKQPDSPRYHEYRAVHLREYVGCGLFSDVPCCHDGERWGAHCHDVDACAQSAPERGKYAFVHVFYGSTKKLGSETFQNIGTMRQHVSAMRAAGNEVDIVLLTEDSIENMSAKGRKVLEANEVVLKQVPWALPPTLTWRPAGGKITPWHHQWCGPVDLIRVHVLGLTEYDAVLYLDTDVQIQNDPTNLFRCAATGRFLSSPGPAFGARRSRFPYFQEPFNLGMFASRPDKRLVRAVELFAVDATFDWKTGWAGSGWLPNPGGSWGSDCGQGYFHTLFYLRNRTQHHREALAAAGLLSASGTLAIEFVKLDSCIWNYFLGLGCPQTFDCSKIVLHHKPILGGRRLGLLVDQANQTGQSD